MEDPNVRRLIDAIKKKQVVEVSKIISSRKRGEEIPYDDTDFDARELFQLSPQERYEILATCVEDHPSEHYGKSMAYVLAYHPRLKNGWCKVEKMLEGIDVLSFSREQIKLLALSGPKYPSSIVFEQTTGNVCMGRSVRRTLGELKNAESVSVSIPVMGLLFYPFYPLAALLKKIDLDEIRQTFQEFSEIFNLIHLRNDKKLKQEWAGYLKKYDANFIKFQAKKGGKELFLGYCEFFTEQANAMAEEKRNRIERQKANKKLPAVSQQSFFPQAASSKRKAKDRKGGASASSRPLKK